MKYRKKPVEIEAFRLGIDYMPDWFMDRVTTNDIILRSDEARGIAAAEINTLEGVMRADYGDFIIKGVKGEIYPCKPDIFAATYEPVPVRRSKNELAARMAKINAKRVAIINRERLGLKG